MKIMDLIREKSCDNMGHRSVTIAFLGDSVTQGCFEIYQKADGNIETVFDKNSAYHNYLYKIFSVLFPSVPVNIINAGISGDNAPHGLERLENDVLRFEPDLVVVCFGLNDCGRGMEGIESYLNALRGIFAKLKENGTEAIFMTPNMMNTCESPFLKGQLSRDIAKSTMKTQNEGILDVYLDGAKKAAQEYGIPVCDCYEKWKRLARNGVDTTELLANKINHPSREMNWLFAVSLMDTILDA